MKKILYSILLAGMSFVGCTDFDDPVVEKYGDGPSVSIEVTATSDSAFTFTITPAKGAQYYSFVVAKGNAPQQLNAASLLKGNYSGLTGSVLKAADAASYTCDMYAKDAPLCEPNTTYQIYAVAASDKGITGEIATASATTTDEGIPAPKTFKGDAANKAVAVTFSEPVVRGEGAISAKYYKEWELANPVVLEEGDFTVSIEENVVTFTAPETPAGAYVAYSWEAGAFKDSYGNDCPAVNSGLNTNTGKFVNACVRNALEAFVIADSNITAPKIDTSFVDWTEFTGEITFDFELYRNEKTVKSGDLKVVYTNAAKNTVLNLSPDNWIVSGKKLYFELPEAPQFGDYVSLQIEEGVFTDVYGNPNEAYQIENAWLLSYGYERDMIIGTYTLTYTDYFTNDEFAEVIEVKADPESENGVLLKGFYSNKTNEIKAIFNGDYGTLSIFDEQLLLEASLYFMNAEEGAVVLSIAANGDMNTEGMWGYYIVSESSNGWARVAMETSFVKQTTEQTSVKLQTKHANLSTLKLHTFSRK